MASASSCLAPDQRSSTTTPPMLIGDDLHYPSPNALKGRFAEVTEAALWTCTKIDAKTYAEYVNMPIPEPFLDGPLYGGVVADYASDVGVKYDSRYMPIVGRLHGRDTFNIIVPGRHLQITISEDLKDAFIVACLRFNKESKHIIGMQLYLAPKKTVNGIDEIDCDKEFRWQLGDYTLGTFYKHMLDTTATTKEINQVVKKARDIAVATGKPNLYEQDDYAAFVQTHAKNDTAPTALYWRAFHLAMLGFEKEVWEANWPVGEGVFAFPFV